MLIRDCMSRHVFTLRVDKKIFVAQEIMHWAHVRHVPVVDGDHKVVGIVSHRDLLRVSISTLSSRVADLERNQHLWSIPVKEVMRTDVRSIAPDATVQQAAQIMREWKIGCLPVVAEGKLVGIVTEHDLLKLLAETPA